MSSEMGLDPGVFGRFDLAALVQPQLKFLLVVCSARSRARNAMDVIT